MLDANAEYSEYRGRRYREAFWGDAWLAVERDPGSGPAEFPDAIELGSDTEGAWAKLPKQKLTRRWREVVHARWHGTEVEVRRVLPDGRVVLGYSGDPAVAAQLGMEGDQYNWWTAIAPPEEVEITRIETREKPL